MQQITDPYRALGVARAATEAEIKAAHRKLAKRYHPDTGDKSDATRFLRVQEAYRVLSDPLLRKEWDARHAPGPIRADRPTSTPRPPRRPAQPAAQRAESAAPPPSAPPPAAEPDARSRPRTSRAYTWSASEVPWWEEGTQRSAKRQPGRQRPHDADARDADRSEPHEPDASAAPQPGEPVFNAQQDFDVYNRSSGAAWSMAARAYFRKGDAELPKRGSFHHQGTQPLTAGRARSAAEAEARRRAAAEASAEAASARAAAASAARASANAPGFAAPRPSQRTTTDAAHSPASGTTRIVRRSLAAPWPTMSQRFGLALLAWVPLAALISLAAARQDDIDQLLPIALIAATLALLLAVPRIAYVAALATVLVLAIGGLFVVGMVLGGPFPSVDRIILFVGGLLAVAYMATGAVVAIGPPSMRPWSGR